MRIQARSLLLAAASTAHAAECWGPVDNGIYTSYAVGTQLAWSLRSTLCTNYWYGAATNRVQLYHGSGTNCGSEWVGDGKCWGGYFECRGQPTQQSCWDTTEQIITQCASGPGGNIHPTGGYYLYGTVYAQGGYYFDGYTYSARRRGLEGSREVVAGPEMSVRSVEEELEAGGVDVRLVEVLEDMSVMTDVTYHVDGSKTDNLL